MENYLPVIKEVHSYQVKVGCQLIDDKGDIFICHQFCENKEQLDQLIILLKTNQFIGRLYTAPIVYDLYNKMFKMKMTNLPDIEENFSQTSKMNS